MVGVIGGCNDDGVDAVIGDQLTVVAVAAHMTVLSGSQSAELIEQGSRRRQAGRMRIGKGDDVRPGQGCQA